MLLKPKAERKFNTNGGKRGFDPETQAERDRVFKRRRAEERAKLDKQLDKAELERLKFENSSH